MFPSDSRGTAPLTRVILISGLVVGLGGVSVGVLVWSVCTTGLSPIEQFLSVVSAFLLSGLAGYIAFHMHALTEDTERRTVVGGIEPIPEEETDLSADEFEILDTVERGDGVMVTTGKTTNTYHVTGVTSAGGGKILRFESETPVNIVLDARAKSAQLVVGIGPNRETQEVTDAALRYRALSNGD